MEQFGPSLRRTRRKDHPAWRAVVALVVSLAVNALLLSQVDSSFVGILGKTELRPVALSPLSAAEWKANRSVRPATSDRPRQYVDIGPADPEAKAKDRDASPEDAKARFLAERDSRVEKETRSRHADSRNQVFAPLPAAPVIVVPPGEAGQARRHQEGREGKAGAAGAAADRLALARPSWNVAPRETRATEGGGESLPEAAFRPAPEASPAPAPEGGEGGLRLQGRFDPRLATSPATVAQILAGPKGDVGKEIEEGEGTYLNARADRYATYFNRIYQSVAGRWKADEAYAQRDPDHTLFPARDWKTVVNLTVSSSGDLTDARVVKGSGLDFLDRAAVDAIKNAQPFPNVPRGILDGDGSFRLVYVFTLSVEPGGPRAGLGWRRY